MKWISGLATRPVNFRSCRAGSQDGAHQAGRSPSTRRSGSIRINVPVGFCWRSSSQIEWASWDKSLVRRSSSMRLTRERVSKVVDQLAHAMNRRADPAQQLLASSSSLSA